jgi:sterol desaturase/sphingolipid hydroxylase (fatty acid hydroxylase superfamily)
MAALEAFLLAHEGPLRMAAFFGLLIVFFILEQALPRRRQQVSAAHYGGNLLLGSVNIVLLRLIAPAGLVGIALLQTDGGLLGLLAVPLWLKFILCLVLLDLTLYAQHRLFHKLDFLWRWHAPHHGDRDLNVASGVRFHPGEALISFAVKAAAIAALGAPVAAVILFEVMLSGASLFNHANWSMGRADAVLRKLIVTPDMHRLHHSRAPREALMNFGFFLSVWDRLFASYKHTPDTPHEALPLGLDDVPKDDIGTALLQPFRRR